MMTLHAYEKLVILEHGTYEPAEDSYLLAAAVEKYAFGKALDMGCGSGIQGMVAAMKGCTVTFTDKSMKALEATRANLNANKLTGSVVQSDMFSNVEGKFNTIIFNPPYLPEDGLINADVALSGGKGGRKYIDEFLRSYKRHVLKRHVVLLLESSINNYQADADRLGAEIVGKSRFFFEEVAVLKLQ